MPLIKIPEIIMEDYNFTPLPKTWWHLEAWSIGNRTYRLAKRSDHTGVLVQLDIDKFYAAQD